MKDFFRSASLSSQDRFADGIKAREAAYTPKPKVGPDIAKEEGGKEALAKLLLIIKGKQK